MLCLAKNRDSSPRVRQSVLRLAREDGFRAELKADPIGALARRGIHVDPWLVPAEVHLPSKEALASVLDEPIKPWGAYFLGR